MEAHADEARPSAPPPPKFSRYRSVRKPTVTDVQPTPPVPQANLDIQRSMSRYRKVRPANVPATAPPLPASTQNVSLKGSAVLPPSREPKSTRPTRAATAPVNNQDAQYHSGSEGRHRPHRLHRIETSRSQPDSSQDPDLQFDNDAQREAYAILNGEVNRQKKLRGTQADAERARQKRAEAEAEARQREVEEHERACREEKERQRQEARELAEARTAQKEAVKAKRHADKEAKRAASKHESPGQPRTPPEEDERDYRDASSSEKGHGKSRNRVGGALARVAHETPDMLHAVPKTAPGFDAPKSASNAGTRKVIVKYHDRTAEASVTPQITSVDIIAEVASAFELDPKKYILAESFKQVGLERPLRLYEHIREVMNSWDQDDQNNFIVLPVANGEGAALEVQDAPSKQPDDISVYLHYSNKPGSWDKRWITLRSDGQVLVSKRPGEDMKNICHMTDFDIYMPTSRRIKKIKPPKKYCFAVKSLQKSAMFLSSADFVHFFATKDREQAAEWYKAVQSWRSWYLVHGLGLGKNAKNPATSAHRTQKSASMSSVASKPYEIGSFKPLVAEDMFSNAMNPEVLRRPSDPTHSGYNNRGGPPVSFPKKLTKDNTIAGSNIIHGTPESSGQEPFVSSGLLGRTYSQRKAALDRNGPSNDPSSTNTLGPEHFLNSSHKPLVDLTPAFKEPPQHLNKGRGYHPDRPIAGGLVQLATGRDELYTTPVATLFQRPQPPSSAHVHQVPQATQAVPRRSGTVRSTARSRTAGGATADSPTDAFTGSGLLGPSLNEGVYDHRHGRGVATGTRDATEPLLDMNEGEKYVPGSLLAGVEKWEVGGGKRDKVVVDRSRVSEGVRVRIGEAA